MVTDPVKESKRRVAIEVIEPEVTASTVCDFIPISVQYGQRCVLCENIRELPEGMYSQYCNIPWICDECKEAIAFIKKQIKHNPLEPILD